MKREELLEAVRGGESISAVRRLGIPRQTIRSWRSADSDFARPLSHALGSDRRSRPCPDQRCTGFGGRAGRHHRDGCAWRELAAARWLLERIDRARPPLEPDPFADVIDIAKRRRPG
jgi:hypothetical protein